MNKKLMMMLSLAMIISLTTVSNSYAYEFNTRDQGIVTFVDANNNGVLDSGEEYTVKLISSPLDEASTFYVAKDAVRVGTGVHPLPAAPGWNCGKEDASGNFSPAADNQKVNIGENLVCTKSFTDSSGLVQWVLVPSDDGDSNTIADDADFPSSYNVINLTDDVSFIPVFSLTMKSDITLSNDVNGDGNVDLGDTVEITLKTNASHNTTIQIGDFTTTCDAGIQDGTAWSVLNNQDFGVGIINCSSTVVVSRDMVNAEGMLVVDSHIHSIYTEGHQDLSLAEIYISDNYSTRSIAVILPPEPTPTPIVTPTPTPSVSVVPPPVSTPTATTIPATPTPTVSPTNKVDSTVISEPTVKSVPTPTKAKTKDRPLASAGVAN